MPTHPTPARHWLLCLLLLSLAALCTPASAAQQRIALVIGNAAYTDGPLKNPVNDARAMDQKLASLGFRVQRIENLKRTQIGRAITAFANTVRAGDDVVVFYAGHGVQVKGINYMPAVDADIQSEEDVPLNSLNLNSLMERLDEAKAGLKILFLDACRNNPYARSFRSGDRGLARVGAAPSGTLIHFATRPGSVAADGGGANGLYTSELLRHMDSPNVPIEVMLKRVSAAVETASKGAQEPWTEGSIRGEFYFRGTGAGAGIQIASVNPEPTLPTTMAIATDDPDTVLWTAVGQSNNAADYKAYLMRYPNGRYSILAQSRLDQIDATEQEERKLWQIAENGNKTQVDAYMNSYPAGRYISIARERLVALRKADADMAEQNVVANLINLFNSAKTGDAKKFAEIAEMARRGHAEAQNFAGSCYLSGYGVEKDAAEATRWFIRSSRQGNSHATKNLEILRNAGFMVDLLERSTQ